MAGRGSSGFTAELERHPVRRLHNSWRVHLSTVLLPNQPGGNQGKFFALNFPWMSHSLFNQSLLFCCLITYSRLFTSLANPTPPRLHYPFTILPTPFTTSFFTLLITAPSPLPSLFHHFSSPYSFLHCPLLCTGP